MRPEQLISTAIEPAFRLLPPRMDSRDARIILLAIAYQESAMKYRRQIGGPARGYWQFEAGGGVRGVLNHASSKQHIQYALGFLDYEPTSNHVQCHTAIEHNDVLAALFARLLLWTDSKPMPSDADSAWALYLRTWRPGKPHPEKWAANYQKAEAVISSLEKGVLS